MRKFPENEPTHILFFVEFVPMLPIDILFLSNSSSLFLLTIVDQNSFDSNIEIFIYIYFKNKII